MSAIDCDICHREAQDSYSLNCTTCARSTLYSYRIELAKSLLGKEAVARQVEAIGSGDLTAVQSTTTLDGAIVDLRDCARSHRIEAVLSETRAINDNIHRVSTKAVEFKKAIEEMKSTITERKARIKTFKSDAESAAYGLNGRSSKTIEQLKKSTREIEQRWEEKFDGIMQARAALSRKMARLAGLKMNKIYDSKLKAMREVFEVSKVQIFDLRQLNTADPEVLTASLTQIAYLVVRVSTYLSIRLPAEMQLPNREHPTGAAIFPPTLSYMPRSRAASMGDIVSPTSSRLLDSGSIGCRLLSVTKPLPQLYKEDSAAFSLFIEAVTLLGWNIAWLCRAQGMGSLSHWTDLTNIGRNLYQLLAADTRGTSKTLNDRTKQKPSATSPEESTTRLPTHFGRFSHGSAKHFIVSKKGNELMRGWKLATFAQVVDKIKNYLLAEMQGAEWEMLDAGEWHDHADTGPPERPVVVHSRSGKPGTAGWTKLRTRETQTDKLKTKEQNDSALAVQR